MENSRLHIAAILVLTLAVVRCKEVRVQWTIEGVSQYSGTYVEVELGDLLVLECVAGQYSNAVYNPNVTQFERCNSTEETSLKVGECLGSGEIDLEIKRSSTTVASGIPYEAGTIHYFTSYSNGTLNSAISEDQRSGGQCTQGLKLAVAVAMDVEVTTPTVATTMPTEETTTKPPATTDDSKPTEKPTDKPTDPAVGGLNSNGRSVHTKAWLHVLLVVCTLLTIAALRH